MTNTEMNTTRGLTIPEDLWLIMRLLHWNQPPVEIDDDPEEEWRTIRLGWDADGNSVVISYGRKSVYQIESGLWPVDADYFWLNNLPGLEAFVERFQEHSATIVDPSHWQAIFERG